MTASPAPVSAGRRWPGPVAALALLFHGGTTRAAELPPALVSPLVPPQSFMAPPSAAVNGLGPSLRLPQPGADLPRVPVPLQWPGELPAAPAPASPGPLTPSASPGPQPRTPAPAGTGGPLRPDEAVRNEPPRQLVLDRHRRLLMVLENGRERRRFPVAVGMPGWETPVGQFEVIEKTANPVWEHPATGVKIQPGPDNPLGSRWIGFHRDCRGRKGFNGVEHLELKGCVIAGFHGTPNRASVGRAVSHGCVRLFDENVKELFDLVRIGTPVTVLP
ncbi:MAG: L,D-transpeptidase family protein [Cyanobium sp.]